jgi:eukaryotic-like serine/threonine-protein kinase
LPEAPVIPPGTRFGPYEITCLLGTGGMGEVYRARDSRLERDVAIKVLPAESISSSQARERFHREAQAVAALQHPNICTLHDVGETPDGQSFIVMELLRGETLQQRLVRGPFDAPELIEIMTALADALHVAHAAGIVHRDVKPANIFLTDRGPKILDFGLAKADRRVSSGGAIATALETRAVLTEVGSTIGTLAYMSPEQLRGQEIDSRTDLFSFGLVLYEMATGRPAFTGATSAVIGAAILHHQPEAPRRVRPVVPDGIEQVILKSLEKDRELRYQRASDVRVDLQRVRRTTDEQHGPPVVQPPPRPATRSRVIQMVVAAAVVVAIGVVAYLSRGYFTSPAPRLLTDADTIVLGDFANSTGDPVFDDTLRQGLMVQLQQSPLFRVLSDQKTRVTLGLMGQPADARLTPAIARQLCERTASTAVLDGSIATLGTQYVLGLRATDCRSGNVIDQQQARAGQKEDVLGVLGQIATTFRARIGESLATTPTRETPLAEATTVSLDALKAYTAGLKASEASGGAAGIAHFTRAVEIDPTFAAAYALLGLDYSGTGETRLAIDNIRKAGISRTPIRPCDCGRRPTLETRWLKVCWRALAPSARVVTRNPARRRSVR